MFCDVPIVHSTYCALPRVALHCLAVLCIASFLMRRTTIIAPPILHRVDYTTEAAPQTYRLQKPMFGFHNG
eukprot:9092087-Pyramimonas_sp.AAC.1